MLRLTWNSQYQYTKGFHAHILCHVPTLVKEDIITSLRTPPPYLASFIFSISSIPTPELCESFLGPSRRAMHSCYGACAHNEQLT